MNMFDSVVVAYDKAHFDVAMPVRSMLELYRLYVHMYYCCQKRNLLEVLAGHIPDSEYVVLVAGGEDEKGGLDTGSIVFRQLVELVDGGWRADDVMLCPDDVRRLVHLPGRTVIAMGCTGGREPLARAFLDAGCRAYIGATGAIDQNSTTMFVCAFFMYLMEEAPEQLAPIEAVKRARQLDSQTSAYRYYGRGPDGAMVCL